MAKRFLSTPSARRATRGNPDPSGADSISIHALREEGDRGVFCVLSPILSFLSTPSARRATVVWCHCQPYLTISIHALREEGDTTSRRYSPAQADFYPRPPRGGRPLKQRARTKRQIFLSTPSARRATTGNPERPESQRHFYPRPPRGGRRGASSGLSCPQISIHALREEGDDCRRRQFPCEEISIHALREEGDPIAAEDFVTEDISIHALREEGDLLQRVQRKGVREFLSTPSARRATFRG